MNSYVYKQALNEALVPYCHVELRSIFAGLFFLWFEDPPYSRFSDSLCIHSLKGNLFNCDFEPLRVLFYFAPVVQIDLSCES
jgi:hypothetical protein